MGRILRVPGHGTGAGQRWAAGAVLALAGLALLLYLLGSMQLSSLAHGGRQQQGAALCKPGGGSWHPDPPPDQLMCGGAGEVPEPTAALQRAAEELEAALEAAFEPYAGGFGLDEIEATAEAVEADGADNADGKSHPADVRFWIEVRDGKLTFPRRPNHACEVEEYGCNPKLYALRDGLQRGMAAGALRIPDGLPLLINLEDPSRCPGTGPADSACKAPVLSYAKHEPHLDVLMPHFEPRGCDPHFWPWERKLEIGWFRGAPICDDMRVECSRWRMAQLSWDHPDLLNVTLTVNVTQYGGPKHVEGPPVPHVDFPKWKYLLAIDGSTASYRFAFLLATNSLVLKQTSRQMEWYYPAVHHCVHYYNYWVANETDTLQIVRDLRRYRGNDLVAQHLAANGQARGTAFCMRHLTEEAQWSYWQRLIDKYASLYRGPLPANGGKKGLPPPGARRRTQEAAADAIAAEAGGQPAAAGEGG